MKPQFKAAFFKTNILLIDDNQFFLDTLECKLSDDYLVSTQSSCEQALALLESHYQPYQPCISSNLLVETQGEDDDKTCFTVDFSRIKFIADNPKKQDIISTIIIDYSMPEMNGVEFCEKISHLPVLKIMLTGQADLQIAVDALNKGLVDVFLIKNSEHMSADILSNIDTMQSRFFERQSRFLLSYFPESCRQTLLSPSYSNHFKNIIEQTAAVEYYLLDARGSYLLITADNTRYYFMILFDEQLDEWIDIATDLNADQAILDRLGAKTHAPVFIEESDYKLPVTAWDRLLQPVHKADGYYYCLVG